MKMAQALGRTGRLPVSGGFRSLAEEAYAAQNVVQNPWHIALAECEPGIEGARGGVAGGRRSR